jgi:hypothetical protein
MNSSTISTLYRLGLYIILQIHVKHNFSPVDNPIIDSNMHTFLVVLRIAPSGFAKYYSNIMLKRLPRESVGKSSGPVAKAEEGT